MGNANGVLSVGWITKDYAALVATEEAKNPGQQFPDIKGGLDYESMFMVIMAHEFGHNLGLGHEKTNKLSMMYFDGSGNDRDDVSKLFFDPNGPGCVSDEGRGCAIANGKKEVCDTLSKADPETESSGPSDPASDPATPPSPDPTSPPSPDPTSPDAGEDPKNSEGIPSWIIAIIAVVVILCIALGVLCWMLNNKNADAGGSQVPQKNKQKQIRAINQHGHKQKKPQRRQRRNH